MNELIEQRMKLYAPKTALEEVNGMKEIAQEIILFGLSQTDFFNKVFFCGGTCLRIVHRLNRFSEDLDFTALKADDKLEFDSYMQAILKSLKDFGLDMKISKSKDDSFVKARELKEDSDKWKVSIPSQGRFRKVMIKIEIDTNPPSQAAVEQANLDFPLIHRIRVGTMDTLFAGKIHALLCRPFTKGRDWYDLLWYLKNQSSINLSFLQSALYQMGPFKGKDIKVDELFVKKELKAKIQSQDWEVVKKDMERFLRPMELSTLEFWNEDLFSQKVDSIKSSQTRT